MVLFRPRILLIAAAALSTIVGGMRGAFADMPSAEVSVRSSDERACDGSREDDSGTIGETFEEDDREEEQGEGSHLHLGDLACPGCPCSNVVRAPAQSARCLNGEWHPTATLVHGPPARR